MPAYRKTGPDSIAPPNHFGWLKFDGDGARDLWERPDGVKVVLDKDCLLFRDARDCSIKRVPRQTA
jgi:hypothetical protein